MKTTKQLLCVGGLLLAGAVAQAQNDPDLIDVTNLEQLDAIRYDLNGDGVVDDNRNNPVRVGEQDIYDAAQSAYETAFPSLPLRRYEGYELTTNLDFEDAASYAAPDRNDAWVDPTNGGTTDTEGWEPIIGVYYSFTAIFEGNDYTISNLYINRSISDVSISDVSIVGGLFGHIGGGAEIRNLALKEVSVTMTYTSTVYAGGLVGSNQGTISGCSTTGNANAEATASGNAYAGGLVGWSSGTISGCYATGNADATATNDANYSAYAFAGGLVGKSSGRISDCYATGDANAEATATRGNAYAGGLVGENTGITISGCYAAGDANATAIVGPAFAGGLVGWNKFGGSISACYAMGNAEATATTGTSRAGGLVGENDNGTIRACYATGNAEANAETNARAGGFIGRNLNTGNITACYSIGEATATGNTTDVGGFEGFNEARISKSYFDHETSNRSGTDIGAQTTSDLQSPTDYTGIYKDWNITSKKNKTEFVLWALCEGAEYPKLSVDFDGNGTPSVDEFGPQGSCSLPPVTPTTPGPTTPLSVIDERVTDLETSQGTHDTEITDLETSQATHDTAITDLEAVQTAQDTKITAHDTEIAAHDTEIEALEASQTAQDTKITAHDAEIEALKAKITAFEAATGGQSTAIYNVPDVSASARVYPNPAKHSLLFANLTPGRVYLYKIYTSSGVLLRSDAVQSDEAIDISTLEAGQHLLVLQDDDSREVLRSSLLIE